jgi:DUF971 family protein
LGERHNGIVEVTGSTPVRSTSNEMFELGIERTITTGCPFFLKYRFASSTRDIDLTPTKISLSNPSELSFKWADGSETMIPLKVLRDNCPCASCQGETVLLRTYKPAEQPELPGKYVLKGAQQVGYYALQVYWGVGHQTGIYTWEKLRSLSASAIE